MPRKLYNVCFLLFPFFVFRLFLFVLVNRIALSIRPTRMECKCVLGWRKRPSPMRGWEIIRVVKYTCKNLFDLLFYFTVGYSCSIAIGAWLRSFITIKLRVTAPGSTLILRSPCKHTFIQQFNHQWQIRRGKRKQKTKKFCHWFIKFRVNRKTKCTWKFVSWVGRWKELLLYGTPKIPARQLFEF